MARPANGGMARHGAPRGKGLHAENNKTGITSEGRVRQGVACAPASRRPAAREIRCIIPIAVLRGRAFAVVLLLLPDRGVPLLLDRSWLLRISRMKQV